MSTECPFYQSDNRRNLYLTLHDTLEIKSSFYFGVFLYFCIDMRKYGLIGKQLSHSWSARFFHDKFIREKISDCEYNLFPLPSLVGLREWAINLELSGFNVTTPYKTDIFAHLDHIDSEATAIGAVNCVHVLDRKLIGHNTDWKAFHDSILPLLSPQHSHALILGTGGASKAVAHAFRKLGISYLFVSRTPSNSETIGYDEAFRKTRKYTIIVNATPLGTSPNTDQNPWPDFSTISDKNLCYDLIYNPLQTDFLRMASLHGATICNGLEMLHRQALLSWNIWNN